MKTFQNLNRIALVAFALGMSSFAYAADFDENPAPLRTPPPVYPEQLRMHDIKGMVLIKVSINEEGAVESCEVQKSTQDEFNKPALDAVKRWKFKPAKKAGVAVKANILIPIKFDREA